MASSSRLKRPGGRPRAFEREEALDRAVEIFWADGFERTDVARVALAVGVTKPSLYRLFGNKSSLFVHAIRRYGETIGARPIAAFHAHADLAEALEALLEAQVIAATTAGRPRGCLVACVAVTYADHSPPVRTVIAAGLQALADALTLRFDAEVQQGLLPARPSPNARSRLVIDTMQGLALRARARTSRRVLLNDAHSYVELLLR